MKSLTTVMAEYRSADFGTRLNLYLDCPDLREAFTAIEMEQDALLTPVKKQPDAVDRIDRMVANLLNSFPLSWQARLKRICCG